MIKKKKKLRKREIANIIVSIFLVIFIFGFIFILVSSNLKLKERRAEILEKISQTQGEIEKLEKESEELKAQILQKTNEDYLEKEARERFNLKKPGEEVAVIVEQEQEPSLLPSPTEQKEKSFWQQLLEFFHNF